MKNLIIVGTGENARHAYFFAEEYRLYHVLGFAVDRQYFNSPTYLGLPVYCLDELNVLFSRDDFEIFIGVLWNKVNADRRHLFDRLSKQYHIANLISPKATVWGKLAGRNCWIHDFAVVRNGAKIGNNVVVMGLALVGTDTIIEDHCFLGAKCTIGGGCCIGEQTFVGMNCTVFDYTTVGKKCILGACTVVKRNISDYSLLKTSFEIKTVQYDEHTIEDKLIYSKNVR